MLRRSITRPPQLSNGVFRRFSDLFFLTVVRSNETGCFGRKERVGLRLLFAILLLLGSSVGAEANLCGDGFRSLVRLPGVVARQVRAALSSVSNGVRFYTGRATRDLDARSFALFDRVRANPAAEISEAEMAHLREQGALALFERYRDSSRIVREFNHGRAFWAHSGPGNISRTFVQRTGNTLRMAFLPLLPDIRAGRVRGVYERFLAHEGLRIEDLSEVELSFVERAGLRSDLERFIADLSDYRSGFSMLTRIRANARVVGWVAIAGTSAGVAALNQLGIQDISMEDSVNPNIPVGMNAEVMQTELVFTRCREFPVMIRRRSTMFGFNFQGMTRETTAFGGAPQPLYLRTLLSMPCFREGHIRVRLNLPNDDAHRAVYSHLFERSQRTNLLDLTRVSSERAILELEQVVGGLVPPLLDMNETTVLAFLAARRALGDSRIGAIYRASPTPRSAREITVEASRDFFSTVIMVNLMPALAVGELALFLAPDPCLVGCKQD